MDRRRHISHTQSHTSTSPQRLLLDAFASIHAATSARPAGAGTAAASSHSPPGSTLALASTAAAGDMGVYVGVSQLEYARLSLEQGVDVNAYYATGGCMVV